MFYANVYEIDRAYGGPEEGGWWYDTGHAIRTLGFVSHRKAQRALRLLQKHCECNNKGLHSPGSMLSEGLWREACIECHPARDYPETRPHYE